MKKLLIMCWLCAVVTGLGYVMPMGNEVGASVAYASNGYTIDRSSAWYDRSAQIFGAGVTEDATGEYFTVSYQLVNVNKHVMNVMESKNSGAWVQIGVIDWNRMCSADVGSPGSGGLLFREVADVAARSAGYEKMF